jgi:hypothetical protein
MVRVEKHSLVSGKKYTRRHTECACTPYITLSINTFHPQPSITIAPDDGREGCFTAAATTTGTGPPSTAPAPPDTPPSVALASAAGTGTGAAPGSLYLRAPH